MSPSRSAYFIHDNGGRPFKVEINKNLVTVYRLEEDHYVPTKTFEASNVFVGKSPKNDMTVFSGGYGSKLDGNSILIQTALYRDKYIFIGENVKSFIAKSEIVKYVSPVGNNDVPYPYAIDSEGRYYLITEDVILKPTEEFVEYMSHKNNEPYRWYYDHVRIRQGLDYTTFPKKKIARQFQQKYLNAKDELRAFGRRMGFCSLRHRVIIGRA